MTDQIANKVSLHQHRAKGARQAAAKFRSPEALNGLTKFWADHYADQAEEQAEASEALAARWANATADRDVTQAPDGRGLLWTVYRDNQGVELDRDFISAHPTPEAARAAA